MGKQRRWQFILILSVIALTIYNILPTLFYHSQNLRSPVGPSQGEKISERIIERLDDLEKETLSWLESFCDLIHARPNSIALHPVNPQWITVSFTKNEESSRFRSLLPRAGALIPFGPAKLGLAPQEEDPKQVIVQRLIPVQLSKELFSFAPKGSPLYRQFIMDRAAALAYLIESGGEKKEGPSLSTIFAHFKTADTFLIGSSDSLFSEIAIDWAKERIFLKPHKKEASQPLIDEIARLTRHANEIFATSEEGFSTPFHQLSEGSGFLALKLTPLVEKQTAQTEQLLKAVWRPQHPDLAHMPIVTKAEYEALPIERQALCLLIGQDPSGVDSQRRSVFVTAKGLDRILRNYESHPDSKMAQQLAADFRSLANLMNSLGFFIDSSRMASKKDDIAFESIDIARPLLAATRESFAVRGTGEYALLEVSDVEQRLLTENKIDDKIHEDLVKWQDEYQAAQVSLNPHTRYDVPKPTKSVFWDNAVLTAKKILRGDEKKTLKWGLDLSGGKTVQIELRDATGSLVTADSELKQGINELYARVNKMGVSDVAIRQVGHHIVLDFPSSQALSASELIKSSTMYFHVVNEKFSLQNPDLAETVNRFLQGIWNEALISGKKDAQHIRQIALQHLKSDEGRKLAEAGLKLQDPSDHTISSTCDDTFSKIAILRGDAPEDWYGQGHPLLIVFRNFAMDGSNLDNIRATYDPSKGNFLSFEIRDPVDVFAWTSRFSKEKIVGTSNEKYSRSNGWRMAVILNDLVISAPTLNEPLQDSAMISGHFSQREVNQLAADLKAGSLTFTPHILFEKNVSPELGKSDRVQGITATFIALALVIGAMTIYYRFAGLIASIAVLFNLLILWATLQNLGASLSLAGIAGIILTVGMAVDANVLVFERIKEEFAASGKISSAIQAGYKRAYSAIIDSNVTTIIAALILLNFDAGPIKNFAVNLIIGIASSMFTALFMTRFYFTGWMQNPKHQVLKMSNWIKSTSFDFLKWARVGFMAAVILIVGGGSLLVAKRATIFGMDFTGGYSLYLEVDPLHGTHEGQISAAVEQALIKSGLSESDFQIRELTPSNHLRCLLSTTVEQKGKPFYHLPLEDANGKNPRIDWVVDALKKGGLSLTLESTNNLSSNWTAMSGQMSDTMRQAALLGLLLSFACIFVYLAFRFEYKFAAAALICLLHDVLITLGIMGLLHAAGVPVQIDLNTIAALMTIVGYSLNDTIIIFDRIREETRLMRGSEMPTIVNTALNATLSRTTITSGTTLLVLIALVTLGGSSIFSFALVMTIGVFFGTLSSWFVASPLMLFFHGREEKLKKYTA